MKRKFSATARFVVIYVDADGDPCYYLSDAETKEEAFGEVVAAAQMGGMPIVVTDVEYVV